MGRILAIDYGEKRIGLAITDELQIIASPLDVLPNNSEIFKNLKKLYDYYKFEKIVLGFPEYEKSKTSQEKVKNFKEKLKKEIPIEIVFFNEAFSTVYAENFLKSLNKNFKNIKTMVDKFAAQKILEDFLKNNIR